MRQFAALLAGEYRRSQGEVPEKQCRFLDLHVARKT
jgi:hypothetical protein